MPATDRRARLRAAFPEDVEFVLISSPANIRWASGFSGSRAAVLVARDPAIPDAIATDGRYALRAASECPDLDVVVTRSERAELIDLAASRGGRAVAVEAGHLTVADLADLRSVVDGGVDLRPCRALVEPLRAVKDDDEVASLRLACEITDATFTDVIDRLRPGLTEREIDWMLIETMRRLGADGPAFDAIVASGPNSAIPHHGAGHRAIARGDLLTLDFGAASAGMHADMTRTISIGKPEQWQREIYEAVADIQASMCTTAVPGGIPNELDAAATRRIAATGNSAKHGLGHGVGLEIHEEPFLTPGSASAPLTAGMTITIEPGIYLDGRGGVRIEDSMLVRDAGPPESFTRSSRDLIEV